MYFLFQVQCDFILEMSEVCWMLWDHVLVGIRLHVDYFHVLFIYFRFSVNQHIGYVGGLLDALASCAGQYRITCGLF